MKVNVRRLQCKRCKHRWVPNKREVRMCPRCKSLLWNRANQKKGRKV